MVNAYIISKTSAHTISIFYTCGYIVLLYYFYVSFGYMSYVGHILLQRVITRERFNGVFKGFT